MVVIVPFNDPTALEAAFARHGQAAAALILEPINYDSGCIAPRPGFLKLCRELCDRYGALLIFDEVMTGFRVAPGGAQQLYGIEPDLSTFGKVIGGGMPVGAYGGRREIMEKVAPSGPIYQAGTLSGNPVAMAAGLAMLELIQAPGFHADLERKTRLLADGLLSVAIDAGVPFSVNHVCGMFGLFFTPEKVETYKQATSADTAAFNRFFHAMLARGVYLAPSAFEAGFMSAAHSEQDIADTLQAARVALKA
jgi:glutamate-1-semialdehyde 2,1-aminomutase